MTPEQLAAIKERLATTSFQPTRFSPEDIEVVGQLKKDVAGLIAEVERLRTKVAELQLELEAEAEW